MEPETLYLLQLLGAVFTGGFVGEFFRTSRNINISAKIFMANFLAGSFLSFIIAYVIYLSTKQKEISILLGALLSYQEERFISQMARKLILNWIQEGENKDDDK